MTPRELLRLSRVDKAIRRAVLTMWNPRAFIAARANFDNAPPPPEGMSEPEYASYISEKICSVSSSCCEFFPFTEVKSIFRIMSAGLRRDSCVRGTDASCASVL